MKNSILKYCTIVILAFATICQSTGLDMILQSDIFMEEATANSHEKDIDCEEKNEVEEEERINHSANWHVSQDSEFIIHRCTYSDVDYLVHLEICDPPPEFLYKV